MYCFYFLFIVVLLCPAQMTGSGTMVNMQRTRCCCHHQCGHHGPAVPSAAFLPRSKDPTSRTSNKKRRTKQLHIQKEDGGSKEKRRGKQSCRTSEHDITGRVVTAKGKRGGAIRVHSISSMEHINRNLYFFILAQTLRDARIENDSCIPVRV